MDILTSTKIKVKRSVKNKKKVILIIDEEAELEIINTKVINKSLDNNTTNEEYWENLYNVKYNGNKYAKNTKNFSKIVYGKQVEKPNIYIIPRQRGGPSYKNVQLEYDNAEDIQFCPVSKGFSMQDVSSFTLGPVVGHGLNVVNCAFSKIRAKNWRRMSVIRYYT